MLPITYLILILLIGGALVGVVIAGTVLGGILLVIFMVGFFFHELIQWIRKK